MNDVGDAESSMEVGHISAFMPPATLAVGNGRATRRLLLERGSLRPCTPSFGLGTTKP